ncbi:MAG: ATP synthase F1 subunit gamma [Deltaproteobacteria bacterium]|nr:ATP synthase F1 subunit gamma [Deltaproteobacteria bacterium]MBW2139963.1 ATP synthase F1 subunit gamma [Deltaproteobacteria bacterium]MBW2322196.1 ATP synthase F1 subunit gamma [Deltaproteobacteria bacterium]
MATLKDIQRKIAAVKKTQQITRAMNMVAAAKLRTAQGRIENFRPYASKFADLIAKLAVGIETGIHPFLMQPDEVKKIELVAFSSDRGLCGSFNNNIISGVERVSGDYRDQDVDVSMTLVGRKVCDYFHRRPVKIRASYPEVMNSYDYSTAVQIAQGVSDAFLMGEVHEVWIYYTRFGSVSQLIPTLVKLLPISPPQEEEVGDESDALEYLCEPSAEAILVDLLPKSFIIQFYNAMLETSASENAARMVAMDNATNNCKDMVDDLTMVYNKARQAAITMELMDIVGGAEALKA